MMENPSLVIITSRLLDLHAEADANRLAKLARSGRAQRRGRVSGAFAGLRSLLGGPAEPPVGLPKLTDYPYRS